MKRWDSDRKIMAGFALAFALLAVVPVVVYQNKSLLLRQSQAVAHTHEVTGSARARVRIISAREATKRERRFYEDEPR